MAASLKLSSEKIFLFLRKSQASAIFKASKMIFDKLNSRWWSGIKTNRSPELIHAEIINDRWLKIESRSRKLEPQAKSPPSKAEKKSHLNWSHSGARSPQKLRLVIIRDSNRCLHINDFQFVVNRRGEVRVALKASIWISSKNWLCKHTLTLRAQERRENDKNAPGVLNMANFLRWCGDDMSYISTLTLALYAR